MRGSVRDESGTSLFSNVLPCLKRRRPVVHQAAPTLEEITARVGRLGGVLYRMGERGLDHLAGYARPTVRQGFEAETLHFLSS